MGDHLFVLLFSLYLAILLVLGFVNRKVASLSDFFLASRSLDSPSVGLTLSATVIGGSAVIVTSSLVYTYGLAGLWYDIGSVVGLFVLGIWMAPRIRATRAHSLPDLVGIHYGREAKTASSILLVLVEIGWVALLLQASGYVLTAALGASSTAALFISTLVFVGYTALGGQLAVVRTDKVQIVFVIFSLLTILFAMMSKGVSLPLEKLSFPTSPGFDPSMVVSAFLVMFLSNIVGPDIYSKLFSARSPGDAARGSISAALIRVLVSLTVGAIALLGFSSYGSGLAGGSVIPTVAGDMLPPALSAVVMLGLLSIMVSSADSCLLSGATFLSWDLMRTRKWWIRPSSVVLIGSLSFLFAIYSPTILSTLVLTYTVFSAGIVPSVILSFWKDRLGLNGRGVMASLLVGGGTVILLHFLENVGSWNGSLLFLPMLLSTASLFLFSRMFKERGLKCP